jgi:1,4-alpha-glucan branching enzyme
MESFSLFTDFDIALFKAGKHYMLYEKLGAYFIDREGITGTYFAVWAPNAIRVTLIGDFNGWSKNSHIMNVRWDSSGIWELFVPGIGTGVHYKYCITSHNGYQVEKADPYGMHMEASPETASVVWEKQFDWTDKKWLKKRAEENTLEQALAIY